MAMKSHEEVLKGLSRSDRDVVESLFAIQLENLERSGLDPKTYSLVRIAALVAIDAPPASFVWNIQTALQMGVKPDDITGVLIALAPTIGLAKIVAAAPEIAFALGIEVGPEEKPEAA